MFSIFRCFIDKSQFFAKVVISSNIAKKKLAKLFGDTIFSLYFCN